MSRHVENQPHDEVFNVSDEDGVGSESAESDDGGRALGKSADDDDFDFASEFGRGGEDSSPSKGAKTKVVTNQPFDEAVDLSASDGSSAGSSPHNPTAAASLRSPANVSTRQSVAPAAAPRAAAAVMPKHSEQQRKTLTVDVGKSSSPSEDGDFHLFCCTLDWCFIVDFQAEIQMKIRKRKTKMRMRAATGAMARKAAVAYTIRQTTHTLMSAAKSRTYSSIFNATSRRRLTLRLG